MIEGIEADEDGDLRAPDYENFVSMFFIALIKKYVGSIEDVVAEAIATYFRRRICDLSQIKEYCDEMRTLFYQANLVHDVSAKIHFLQSFPQAFSKLLTEYIQLQKWHIAALTFAQMMDAV